MTERNEERYISSTVDCRGKGLQAPTKKQKYDRIMKTKITTSIEKLCKSLLTEFATYLGYTRNLNFAEKPDYSYLRKIFAICEGFQYDFVFDWTAYKHWHKQAAKAAHGTIDVATGGQTAASALKQAPLQECKLPLTMKSF